MKFYLLTQKVYDWYKEHINDPLNFLGDKLLDNIYITDGKFNEDTEDEIQGSYRMYKGDKLVGDAYVPNSPLSSTITKNIGKIKKGSTIADLVDITKGSMSSVIDMMLCPNYASVYYEPYFVATSEVESPYCFVGDLVPQARISSEATAQAINTNIKYSCNAGPTTISKVILGGSDNVLKISDGNNANDGYTADDVYRFIKPGVVTFEYSISCEQGPKTILGKDNTLKDSEGNPTQYCSLSEDVLIPAENEEPSSQLTTEYSVSDGDSWVLSSRANINPVQFTYFAAYPLYYCEGVYSEIDGHLNWHVSSMIKSDAESSYKAILDAEGTSIISLPIQKKAIILIPYNYHIAELYMEAHNGTFSTYNIIDSLILKDNVRISNGRLVHVDTPLPTDYKAYVFNDMCLGDRAQYQIKITK